MYKLGLCISVAMFVLLAARVQAGLGIILAVYGFTAISVLLAYAVLTPLFAPELTGRLSTASNNAPMFLFSFAFQWGVGAGARLYPVVEGRYFFARRLQRGARDPRRAAACYARLAAADAPGGAGRWLLRL